MEIINFRNFFIKKIKRKELNFYCLRIEKQFLRIKCGLINWSRRLGKRKLVNKLYIWLFSFHPHAHFALERHNSSMKKSLIRAGRALR